MKRIDNLYDKIISLKNLRLADENARRGKTNTYGVKVHDKNREQNLLALHEALLTKTFKTSPYDVFTIYEPKERIIYRLPYYPDRIVHHAVMNVLEPIWVRLFTYNTYSCIKGRGIEGCARRVDKIIKSFEGKPLFCLKIDIKKCYPSMRHRVLKRLIRRKIKDKDLLCLLDEIIDSASMDDAGRPLTEADKAQSDPEDAHGLPIGNYQIFPVAKNRYDRHGRALDYVGYKFFREQKLMRKSIKQNFCREAARLNKREKPLSQKAYKQAVCPWLGWAKHSNSRHLLKTIIKQKYYGIL